MKKPLVITDCDEVLLRMVVHFSDWLAEAQDVIFDIERGFMDALRWQENGKPVSSEDTWRMLNLFFDTEMHRQDEVPGAIRAMAALGECAEVVVLTNLKDFRRESRERQLSALGINVPVYTNQGPKGPALQEIVALRGGERPIFFIDDLAHHHDSVAEVAPHVTRLHFVGEPIIAGHVDCAFQGGKAHARIDRWDRALPWLLSRIEGVEA